MGVPRDIARAKHGPAPVQIGDVIADKYVVEQLLGVGGMGVVVAARHRELNELRAIKLLRPEATIDDEAVERFLREARAAVRLKSMHAVKIHDVGRMPGGEPFMVMEYLDGMDLKAMLRQRGPFPVVETAGLVLQAIEAVAEAHAAGIVHRDLKPGNLFVTTGLDGTPFVKVLDFGISKLTGAIAAGAGMDMTKTSSMLGTPYYMSPEQMRSSRGVDPRSDVWSLGVILYQLLTGRVPFKENTITALCASVLQDQPVPLTRLRPEIPPEFEQIVLHCLQKDPAKRFRDVGELAAGLVSFGPPDAATGAARIARLLGQPSSAGSASMPSMPSALASGGFPQQAGLPPAMVGEIEPATTPLSQNRPWADPSATAASWGRTGARERPRLPPRLKVALVLGALGALLLGAVVLVTVSGGPSETTAEEGSGGAGTVAAGTAGPGTGGARVGSFGSEVATLDRPAEGGAGGAGGAKQDAGKPAKKGGSSRPVRNTRPRPEATSESASGDPFGAGRK